MEIEILFVFVIVIVMLVVIVMSISHDNSNRNRNRNSNSNSNSNRKSEGRPDAARVSQWSSCDLHCLDWNETDVNLLVTGTADGECFVFDRRKMHRDKGSAGVGLEKSGVERRGEGGEVRRGVSRRDEGSAGAGETLQLDQTNLTLLEPRH